MLIVGLSGGMDAIGENRSFLFHGTRHHDSATVLVEGVRVVTAIEEERLSRIKHTSKGAISAIEFCLRRRKITLNDVDQFIVCGDEPFLMEDCGWPTGGSHRLQPV
jgi:carbamoyltransferase